MQPQRIRWRSGLSVGIGTDDDGNPKFNILASGRGRKSPEWLSSLREYFAEKEIGNPVKGDFGALIIAAVMKRRGFNVAPGQDVKITDPTSGDTEEVEVKFAMPQIESAKCCSLPWDGIHRNKTTCSMTWQFNQIRPGRKTFLVAASEEGFWIMELPADYVTGQCLDQNNDTAENPWFQNGSYGRSPSDNRIMVVLKVNSLRNQIEEISHRAGSQAFFLPCSLFTFE